MPNQDTLFDLYGKVGINTEEFDKAATAINQTLDGLLAKLTAVEEKASDLFNTSDLRDSVAKESNGNAGTSESGETNDNAGTPESGETNKEEAAGEEETTWLEDFLNDLFSKGEEAAEGVFSGAADIAKELFGDASSKFGDFLTNTAATALGTAAGNVFSPEAKSETLQVSDSKTNVHLDGQRLVLPVELPNVNDFVANVNDWLRNVEEDIEHLIVPVDFKIPDESASIQPTATSSTEPSPLDAVPTRYMPDATRTTRFSSGVKDFSWLEMIGYEALAGLSPLYYEASGGFLGTPHPQSKTGSFQIGEMMYEFPYHFDEDGNPAFGLSDTDKQVIDNVWYSRQTAPEYAALPGGDEYDFRRDIKSWIDYYYMPGETIPVWSDTLKPESLLQYLTEEFPNYEFEVLPKLEEDAKINLQSNLDNMGLSVPVTPTISGYDWGTSANGVVPGGDALKGALSGMGVYLDDRAVGVFGERLGQQIVGGA